MKNAHQQSKAFRKAIHAERAREAYREARRGGIDDFEKGWEPEDLSAHAPTPSANGWQGLGA